MNVEGNLKNKNYKYTCEEMEEKIFSDNMSKLKKVNYLKDARKNSYKYIRM